jgi:hypothetical protein
MMFILFCRVHPSRSPDINRPIGATPIDSDSSYYKSPHLQKEVTSGRGNKLCGNSKQGLQAVSVSAQNAASMADHREQGSNKSRQTRCGTVSGNNRSRGRRSSPRGSKAQAQAVARNMKVETPSLLVQNLLETLK